MEDLLNANGIALLLGCNRQQVHLLVVDAKDRRERGEVDETTLPEPFGLLNGERPVWRRADIEPWKKVRERLEAEKRKREERAAFERWERARQRASATA